MKDLINDIIGEFVSQGKLFTAYDVTTEARKRTLSNVRHDLVRECLQETDEFVNNDYSSELVTLDTIGYPKALVYYPLGGNPFDYHLTKQDVQDPRSHTTAVTSNAVNCVVTAENRVNIPKDFLSICDNNGQYQIVIDGNTEIKTANSDGRVRVRVPDSWKMSKVSIDMNDKSIILSAA